MRANLILLESELATVLEGLNARECQLTPMLHPHKWNVQQIVEHLILTYRSTVEVLQVRLERGRPTQAHPSLQQRLGHLYLIRLGYFPNGRLAPAHVAPNLPASLSDGPALTARIHSALQTLDEVAGQAEAIFGNTACASHAVLGPLSISQWVRFHLVHGRHHVKQIRKIRQDHVV